ncbi:MAG: acyl-CoA dehydrogenase family protein [Pseudomonadota bacterium]
MNLELNEDQQLIDHALERYLKSAGDYAARRALAQTAPGYAQEDWQFFADIGLLAMSFPEQFGGQDAGFGDTALVMERFGKELLTVPYLAGVVLAGGVLRRVAASPLRAECLDALGQGRMLLAAGIDPDTTNLRAQACEGGYRIDGGAQLVMHGPAAQRYIVTAELNGAPALLLVDAGPAGPVVEPYRLIDGSPACDLAFDEVVVARERLLAHGESAASIVQDVLAEARAALCAEAAGCMQALFGMTLDYVRQRKQFGRAIGSFQVIQHRLADGYTALEQVKSMALLAARSVGSGAASRHRDVAAAKAFIGEAGIRMGHDAIQLHGAMGMTEELAVGGYHKRLLVIDALLGDACVQVGRFIAMEPECAGAALA